MSKISQIDRKEMVQHLRTINKGAINANAKHSKNIQKQIDHTITLTKFMAEDRARIERLNRVVAMKQGEIKDLQKENMDLLWDLAKMEKRLAEAEKVESEVANYEKKITKFINEESVDN